MTVIQKIRIKLSFGKGQFHFVEEKAKVNAEYYVNKILPNLIEDCRRILPGQFIFQQDGLRLTQRHWRRTGLAEIAQSLSARKSGHRIHLISTLLTIMCGGAMLDKYQRYVPKPTNISELKTVLKAIWSDLPQGPIDEAVLSFRKRLQACIKAAGGHFEHVL